MTSVYRHRPTSSVYFLTKGAFEALLKLSTAVCDLSNKRSIPLDEIKERMLQEKVQSLAEDGLRVLAIGWKILSDHEATPSYLKSLEDVNFRDKFEHSFTFGGLVGLMDPPRKETKGSVSDCRQAGIKVHMITGDHPSTARSIAKQVGIIPSNIANDSGVVMTSSEFDLLSDEDIDALPELPLVLARCSPETKVKMVAALHRRNKYVAMTGDGVNDSPAIKQADVGIAMGLGGSDVTKQASDITLTDDNFHSIVSAIKEGRRIFSNIKKFTLHLLSGNVSEVVTLVIGLAIQDFSGTPVFPCSPLQILWINMVTSSPIALCLGIENASSDVMTVAPDNSGVFTWELILDTFIYGCFIGAFALGNFLLTLAASPINWLETTGCNRNYNNPKCDSIFKARSVSFYTISILLLFHGLVCRHHLLHLWEMNWKGTKALLLSVIIGVIAITPLAYIPTLNTKIFYQKPFDFEWGFIIASVILFATIVEVYKELKKRYFRLN